MSSEYTESEPVRQKRVLSLDDLFRTKEVTVVDKTVTIGELSVDQVEELIFAEVGKKETDPGKTEVEITIDKKSAHKTLFSPVVAASLRNVEEGNANWFQDPDQMAAWKVSAQGTSWNPRQAGSLGFLMVEALYKEIGEFTGLRVELRPVPGSGQPSVPGQPGEAKAAANSTSQSSAA